ncbi:M28 family peptidase [Temperatibacter marinus]|uniref:M28 family peptidase n=1 Tax=Temperatibacter marinus TaxID=1456591 RepID=A0AA52EG36_9PROT|nr:M28 family peptidase [Temperatibacter marinus]WND02170.1 M28 family peptidase [Temperatibacter marinus]
MAVKAKDIISLLSLYAHRGCGSEEEMYAREELLAILEGEPGVTVKEEGFYAPSSYLPFFWIIFSGVILGILITPYSPLVSLILTLCLSGSFLLFMDWRYSPLIQVTEHKITANLVATKTTGYPLDPLIILMAHLDSAPASFAYRKEQISFFKITLYCTAVIMIFSSAFPLMHFGNYFIPDYVRFMYSTILFLIIFITSIDYWRYGYTPGANDNLSGVTAATTIARRCFRDMPENAEVRLVITSAEEAGMLGAKQYLGLHDEELMSRPTYVLNIDSVGAGKLCYVSHSGTFSETHYKGPVIETAFRLSRDHDKFSHIRSMKHHVGDFDTIWFMRAGIPSLTLAAYDEEGAMPHIHTPEDTVKQLDHALIEEAIDYGEAIVRRLAIKEMT